MLIAPIEPLELPTSDLESDKESVLHQDFDFGETILEKKPRSISLIEDLLSEGDAVPNPIETNNETEVDITGKEELIVEVLKLTKHSSISI